MRLTCAQRKLLKEGRWSKCPGCGSKEAYQGFKGDWECPEDECKFFSQRRKEEIKGPTETISKPSFSLPTDEEWDALPKRATASRGITNIKTTIGDYQVSTVYFDPAMRGSWPYETAVWGPSPSTPGHDKMIVQRAGYDLEEAKANHEELVKAYSS
jgi:hypothetical protein